jgi:hypothetical protein
MNDNNSSGEKKGKNPKVEDEWNDALSYLLP